MGVSGSTHRRADGFRSRDRSSVSENATRGATCGRSSIGGPSAMTSGRRSLPSAARSTARRPQVRVLPRDGVYCESTVVSPEKPTASVATLRSGPARPPRPNARRSTRPPTRTVGRTTARHAPSGFRRRRRTGRCRSQRRGPRPPRRLRSDADGRRLRPTRSDAVLGSRKRYESGRVSLTVSRDRRRPPGRSRVGRDGRPRSEHRYAETLAAELPPSTVSRCTPGPTRLSP